MNPAIPKPSASVAATRRTRRALREPVSVNNRTGLRHAEMEIGKWRQRPASETRPASGIDNRSTFQTDKPNPEPHARQALLRRRRDTKDGCGAKDKDAEGHFQSHAMAELDDLRTKDLEMSLKKLSSNKP